MVRAVKDLGNVMFIHTSQLSVQNANPAQNILQNHWSELREIRALF